MAGIPFWTAPSITDNPASISMVRTSPDAEMNVTAGTKGLLAVYSIQQTERNFSPRVDAGQEPGAEPLDVAAPSLSPEPGLAHRGSYSSCELTKVREWPG